MRKGRRGSLFNLLAFKWTAGLSYDYLLSWVRGFIGIYAVLTDRMERPIGQSLCFFIIVLDTVILWLLTSVFYISSSPSQIQEELRS